MRKYFIGTLVLFTCVCVSAQQVDLSTSFKNLKPRNIGPAGMRRTYYRNRRRLDQP